MPLLLVCLLSVPAPSQQANPTGAAKTSQPASARPASGQNASAPSGASSPTPNPVKPAASGTQAAPPPAASTAPVTGNAAVEMTPLQTQQQALSVQQQNWQIQRQSLPVQEQSFRKQEQALPAGQRAVLQPIAYHVHHRSPTALHQFEGEVGQALFYSVPGERSLDSFREHASRISIIAPQDFAIDSDGDLHGSLSSGLAPVATVNAVRIMPLVINADFSRRGATRLLRSPEARDRAVGQLVDTARRLNLAGWQIDFENLNASERDDFTRFVAEVATALHHDGLKLSVAVAARTSEQHTDTWQTFSGVYDYTGLAHSADFLSVMAYPEHDGSHPGPLASYPWVKQVVEHLLLYVPPEKLSLGLPTYQTDWGKRRVKVSIIRRVGRRIRHIIRWVLRMESHNGPADHGDYTLHWDPVLKSSYRLYWRHRRRHIVWIEDERSFAAKLELVSEYHLHGFSVWRIGLEDPHIWVELPPAEHLAKVPLPTAPAQLPTLIDRTGENAGSTNGNQVGSDAGGTAQTDTQIDRY